MSALAEQYGCPSIEFNERITGQGDILRQLDLEKLKNEGWFPQKVAVDQATVITHHPSPSLATKIKKTLHVSTVDFVVTLSGDLTRIIEHNQDINPGFRPEAGRTPLARVRTYLAGRRSLFAHYRTLMANSRIGLAFIRTGISFITIAALTFRILGGGFLLFLEVPLLLLGIYLALDSMWRYLPARKVQTALPPCGMTEPTGGSSILAVDNVMEMPIFRRSSIVAGAAELRDSWPSLSPVMRRRFLASDRTDLAEERTDLACYRTQMAKVRTGLAFVRTGTAFGGLGLVLIRTFPAGSWYMFDWSLVVIGVLMMVDGFLWYFRGRSAGIAGYESVRRGNAMATIWDFFFPHRQSAVGLDKQTLPLPVGNAQAPGIWGTTGLALERTMLAERRNVMARLRTTMARGRMGYSFIRTGLSIVLIGVVFAVYFPTDKIIGIISEALVIFGGLFLIADGFIWSVSAEKIRKQFPYCYGDMEIVLPDYGVPCKFWKKAVFPREYY